jgi:hypothetical protein
MSGWTGDRRAPRGAIWALRLKLVFSAIARRYALQKVETTTATPSPFTPDSGLMRLASSASNASLHLATLATMLSADAVHVNPRGFWS